VQVKRIQKAFYNKKINLSSGTDILIPNQKTEIYFDPNPSIMHPNGTANVYTINHVTKPYFERTDYKNLYNLYFISSFRLYKEIYLSTGLGYSLSKNTTRIHCDSLYDENGNWVVAEDITRSKSYFSLPLAIECRINKYIFIDVGVNPDFYSMEKNEYKSYSKISLVSTSNNLSSVLGFHKPPKSIGVHINLFNSGRIYLILKMVFTDRYTDFNRIYYSSGLNFFLL
jgi:hypothetical protein